MKKTMHRMLNALVTLLAVGSINVLAANRPTADGILVKAYEGSKFESQKELGFIQLELPVGPVDPKAAGGLGKTDVLEGYVTKVDYSMSGAKRSTLEVARNYEQALVDAGFQLIFNCSSKSKTCGKLKFDPLFGEFPYSDEYYLIARATDKATSELLTVAIRVPESHHHHIFVVRGKAMDTGMAKVNAAAMSKGLEQTGHMALYGIQFDFGKASLKPESAPVLAEVAELLKQNAKLRLHVVGHTDNVGAFDTNMTLSKSRAATVVDALVKQHGIAASRLMPHGASSIAPVATNRTDPGRAENRRVELVEM
jgi:OOP family OmpA-OmpF porin